MYAETCIPTQKKVLLLCSRILCFDLSANLNLTSGQSILSNMLGFHPLFPSLPLPLSPLVPTELSLRSHGANTPETL